MAKRYFSSSDSDSDSNSSDSETELQEEEEDELCEYEKRRLENIKRNQEMLKSLGLPVKNPLQSQQKSTTKKRSSRSRPSKKAVKRQRKCSDSEEEWQPWMEEVKSKPRGRGARSKKLSLDNAQRGAILSNITNRVDQHLNQTFESKAKTTRNNTRSATKQHLSNSKPREKSSVEHFDHTISQQITSDQLQSLPECFDSDLSDCEDFWGFPPEVVVNEDIQSKYVYQFELNDRGRELFGENEDSDTEENFKGFSMENLANTEIPSLPSHRYPRREKEIKKYEEPEISDDDDYLFCEDCEEVYEGDCPIHGPLRNLDISNGWDEDSKAFTTVAVPAQLTVKKSDIDNAGLGVFAKEFIPRGVKVGPYEGTVVYKDDLDDIEDTSYMWEINKEGVKPYFLDGRDATESNWLRYVNCARHEDEQNMVAFQYKGEIYYRTFKHIYPGNELLVWYGREYAHELGISVDPGMNPTYKCQGCGSSFVENRSFQIHLKHSAKCAKAHPQVFKCFKCHQIFSELYQLQDHIRRHEEVTFRRNEIKNRDQNEIHSSSDCDNDRLSHRIVSIQSQKMFECKYCGKGFSGSGALQSHIRTHTGEKPYKCQHCGKGFSQSGPLQSHIRTHTGDKPYKCQHCGKGFSRSGPLQYHIRTHTGEKPYKCQHCGKGFSRSGPLQYHIRTHTGEKPYKCQHCGKGFSQSGPLQYHIRTHTGEKPYKCQHCGKGFSQSGPLQRHIRTHTGDKPYKCQHCGKGFSNSGNLQRHIRTHTGDKPYKCQHCGKGFSNSGNLQMHIRTHTGDKPNRSTNTETIFH